MKTFKTIEEMVEYINANENIEKLEDGELTLKDWIEDYKLLEKYKKDYGLATGDKKTLRSQKEELTKKVTELTEQLETVNNELAGLKEVHSSSDKEALQKLIKSN